jgi:hypothetical protein
MGRRPAHEAREPRSLAHREVVVPLSELQRVVLRLLAQNRSPDSYLAGGAALHLAPNSRRFSNALDFFHDSEERVATAFAADAEVLRQAGFVLDVELSQPGHIRALVSQGSDSTRIDWAHDSSWRFMPPVRVEGGGYLLHDVDLAINKVLALAGRDEPRDYVDILYVHERTLPLGALCWAAAGKDPGFTPHSLVDLLKRRGRPHQEELDRLHLVEPLEVVSAKERWLAALKEAEGFIERRPAAELGCLYYSAARDAFVAPEPGADLAEQGVALHFGSPGGVLPLPSGVPIAPREGSR